MKEEPMELNRETAMRLWNKSFGKDSKAIDFAGRTIVKGAYNDRNSEFGWNVDHILPQSKGGTTADHNLVCCHIKTNDEKADKFPCFTANEKSFEIVKVERHYEIRSKSKTKNVKTTESTPNFYDSAAGLRLFKSLKGIQNKKRFVGTVYIYLQGLTNGAVVDFIEKIFEGLSVSYDNPNHIISGGKCSAVDLKITLTNYDMPLKSDVEELLDKCVLLNTYLSAYFLECNYISGYDIFCRGDYFDERGDIFQNTIRENFHYARFCRNTIYINKLILENTSAKEKCNQNFWGNTEYKYDYVFTKLQNNLIKEVNG